MLIGGTGAAFLSLHLHDSSDLSAAQPIGPATRTVIFLIDGVSPADLARVPMPHLADIARRGTSYRQAWVGQMEDVGAASAATIATGDVPRNTGMIGAVWNGPGGGAVQRPTQPQQVQLGSIDQVMQASGTIPLALALKRARPHASILAVGGAGCAVANAAGSWLADYVLCPVRLGKQWVAGAVTGHALPGAVAGQIHIQTQVPRTARGSIAWRPGEEDAFTTRYCLAAMRRTHPALLIVSFDEISARKPSLGQGRAGAVLSSLLRGVDRDIGEIVTELRREGVANRTVFVVTSGAAMPLEGSSIAAATLADSVRAAGGQQAYLGTGEAATIGLQDILQAQPVAQAVQNQRLRGLDAVYFKSRARTGWKYQPQYLDPDLPAAFTAAASLLLSTVASGTSPDVVAVLAPGYAVTRQGDNGSGGPGAQWDSQHVPLIIAGHGAQAGGQSTYPARLADIVPTVAALMGLGTVPADGVVLADALQEPPAGSVSAQRRAASRLGYYVSALESRQLAAGR
jgi:hypothetical protein